MIKKSNNETAIFGAGCFWHVEEAFRTVKGVLKTEAGYTGGKTKIPSYKDVCSGETGHVEAVQLRFDTNIISYEKLLEVFWEIHDPTSLDKQGLDVGNQYKSVIFYKNENQKNKAEKSKKELENKEVFKDRIVTEIRKAEKFWKAEDYHQKYLMKRRLKSCKV